MPAPKLADCGMTDAELRTLALRFESLGGTGKGCEFGIFQRELGAEPLGLLRWADFPGEHIATALETDLIGIGDAEHTVVWDPGPGHNGEWWSRDKRYWMAMRTFVKLADMSYEQMVEVTLKRLRYLRDKLLADLSEGTKIFVYKNLIRNLTAEELLRLHRAVRRYGRNTLLVIQYEDAEHFSGTVRLADDGLLLGSIDHFSRSRDK